MTDMTNFRDYQIPSPPKREVTPEPYQYPLTADPYSIINVYARKRQLGWFRVIFVVSCELFIYLLAIWVSFFGRWKLFLEPLMLVVAKAVRFYIQIHL